MDQRVLNFQVLIHLLNNLIIALTLHLYLEKDPLKKANYNSIEILLLIKVRRSILVTFKRKFHKIKS